MKRLCVLLVGSALLEAAASKAGKNPFLGRWDLTGFTPTGTAILAQQVYHANSKQIGRE